MPKPPVNPDLHVQAKRRFPLSPTLDLTALGTLADQLATLAGADQDGYSYTAGVVQTLRWLATGTTTSDYLALVITTTPDPGTPTP